MKAAAEIISWIRQRPYWEQAAYCKILSGVDLTDADYDLWLTYLLQDAKLLAKEAERPELIFADDGVHPGGSANSGSFRLARVSNAQHLNALVPGQTIEFLYQNPAMTVIYGANGSGKSGYARLFGCIGFSRGDKTVLPDIAQGSGPPAVTTASIELFDGAGLRTIDYRLGNPCPELGSFYVFDSTSVTSHLTKKHAFSFVPAGLATLSALAEATDKVRDRLRQRIAERSKPHQFGNYFPGESAVVEAIRGLSAKTDPRALEVLAQISEAEITRLATVDATIAELKSLNIPNKIERNQKLATSLDTLAQDLLALGGKLSASSCGTLRHTLQEWEKWQRAAEETGAGQFEHLQVSGIGSAVWQKFIKAAWDLARQQHTVETPYPHAGDRCLLCQQELAPDAIALMARFWSYLEAEAQQQLGTIKARLDQEQRAYNLLKTALLPEDSLLREYLATHEPALLERILRYLEAARGLVKDIGAAIADRKDAEFPALPQEDWSGLSAAAQRLRDAAAELGTKDRSTELENLEAEKRTLEHRRILKTHLAAIQEYVKGLKWAQAASKAVGSTKPITQKQNELFGELVTERYLRLFENALASLGRPLKVKVTTTGQKGEMTKQLTLEGLASGAGGMTPEKVLSEGEKRVVALADFLTEVTLDDACGGVLLDDPVTSLDHEWKELIAARLVREAKQRQVIIFTHDLHFLYLLRRQAESLEVEMDTHWMKRGDWDNKPGYVFPKNSPASEKDYKNTNLPKKYLAEAAKAASPEQQQVMLQLGFGALRTCYEVFVMHDLFNGVVMRFEERVSMDRLKDAAWNEEISKEVMERNGQLSRYIEGHSHSDAFGQQKPAPAILKQEIELFEALKKRHKESKKATGQVKKEAPITVT